MGNNSSTLSAATSYYILFSDISGNYGTIDDHLYNDTEFIQKSLLFCSLLFSVQLLCCLGVILWSKLEHDLKWIVIIQFFLFNIGTYGARLWTTFLAITILFMHKKGIRFVQSIWPYMVSVNNKYIFLIFILFMPIALFIDHYFLGCAGFHLNITRNPGWECYVTGEA